MTATTTITTTATTTTITSLYAHISFLAFSLPSLSLSLLSRRLPRAFYGRINSIINRLLDHLLSSTTPLHPSGGLSYTIWIECDTPAASLKSPPRRLATASLGDNFTSRSFYHQLSLPIFLPPFRRFIALTA